MHLCLLAMLIWTQLHARLASAAEPCAAAEPFAGLTYYVAPDGNDKWSGKLARPASNKRDGPVASITGARDRIRQLRSRNQPIRVIVRDGVYRLTAPLQFAPQDGGTSTYPICYQAEKGARPVFSAGRPITGWKPGADGIWWTDIPAVRDGSWYFEQLWVNDRRARRARASNNTVTFTLGVQEQQVTNELFRQIITLHPPDLQPLASLSPAELADVSFVGLHKWNTTRRFVHSIDAQAATITVQSKAAMRDYNPMTAWMPYYLENFLAALDQPGEWFLARSGRLYYKPRPGEEMATAAVVAPLAPRFLQISGNPANNSFVQNLGFDGLSFAHSQWLTPPAGVDPIGSSSADAAIDVQGARNFVLKNCEILHTGTYAVSFWNGTRNAALRRCRLEDLGAGGVRIGDAWAPNESVSYFTKQITLDNNIIRHGGRVFHNAYGVWLGRSSDNQVTHNEIADFFQHGISVGWIWGYGSSPTVRNTISYNHIHHLGWRLLSDIGGIHTLGESDDTVLNNNVIHDIQPFAYGGWGLYLDEGSSDITARNNLVYGNLSGFHLHYGRDNTVSNNIFANNRLRELLKSREESGRSVSFTHNVVYRSGEQLFKGFDTADAMLAQNLYFDPTGRPLRFGELDFAGWQSSGRDAGSLIADPLFADPVRGDYSLMPGSPAPSVGFVPFDASLAGVYGDLAWLDQAARAQYASVEPPPALPSFAHLP